MPILFLVDRQTLVRGYVTGPLDWSDPALLAFVREAGDAPLPG